MRRSPHEARTGGACEDLRPLQWARQPDVLPCLTPIVRRVHILVTASLVRSGPMTPACARCEAQQPENTEREYKRVPCREKGANLYV